MKRKIDLNLLHREEIIISTIKWEALRRNPEYIKFVEESIDERTRWVKPEHLQKQAYWEKLKEFGVTHPLPPDYRPGSKIEKALMGSDGYKNLFCASYSNYDVRMFYAPLTFPPNVSEFFSRFEKQPIIFLVNPYARRETVMAKINLLLDSVTTGLGITGFKFQKGSGRKAKIVEKKRTVPQQRIVRTEEGIVNHYYYMRCFRAWDLRNTGMTFTKIGEDLFREETESGKYGPQDAASKAEHLYKVAEGLITGGYKTFGEGYLPK
jgi:hypothetical protein